jgi:hypothetical protein
VVRDLPGLLRVQLLEDREALQQRLSSRPTAEIDRREHLRGEAAQVRVGLCRHLKVAVVARQPSLGGGQRPAQPLQA